MRGWMGGWVGSGGDWASWTWAPSTIRVQTVVMWSQYMTEMYTIHRIDWDGQRLQPGNLAILISVPQWPHMPCNTPMQFYRVSKKPSVKADLAIYSHVVDVSGQCMSTSLTLGLNLDFSSCNNLVGFYKSIQNYVKINLFYNLTYIIIDCMTCIQQLFLGGEAYAFK